MTEMQLRNETIQLSDYQPHPRNYNRHPAAQVERIAHSLATFGQVRSIVVWRGYLLAGHGVAEAAKALGWGELRADVLPDDYPEHLALAYVAADNELSRLSDPDLAQLASILDEAKQTDEELLRAIGYDDKEFEELLREVEADALGDNAGADTEPQIDKAEELRQKWGVEPGQLWQLGDHRLICGDCTDAAVVERVMGGEKAQAMVSDPPYGVGFDYDNHDDSDNASNKKLVQDAFSLAPSCKIWTPGMINLGRDLSWNEDAKVLCWWKKFQMARSGLGGASTWEPVLVVKVKNGTLPNDHIEMMTDRDPALEGAHGCPKPVGLFSHLIEHLTHGDIYEPFSGSGTTIIACENLKRRCRAVEISPGYVAVALERWHQHTGKTPELLE